MEEAKEIQQEVHVSIEIGKQETEFVKEESTSSENKNEIAVLVKDIKSMVESSEPSFPVPCRINRVPDQLRRVNEEAYTPRLISIGPLHHYSKKLQTMEKIKLKFLKSFLQRFPDPETILQKLLTTVKEMEQYISYCYGESIMACSHNHDFLKIIFVDAIFILELFIRSNDGKSDDVLKEEAGVDLSVLKVDLVLLENQLPFFFIESLFTMAFSRYDRSLIELTFWFFDNFNTMKISPIKAGRIEHFTDLVRTFLQPTSTSLPTRESYWYDELQYPATQLEEAGLKFQVGSNELLFDLDVGMLEIPGVELSNLTEALFQNIIAFEQTRCAGDEFLSGYFAMLGSLIKTTKDMDLLRQYKIVENRFHDSNEATLVVKNLYSSIIRANGNYKLIGDRLNSFYRRPWRTQLHIWKNALKRDYFCNPWRSAATIAAFILLVLTLIQTVCSILQLK